MSARLRTAFLWLIVAQAAHSIEEYAGRLWESFPPARLVSGLVSSDLELNAAATAEGFIVEDPNTHP